MASQISLDSGALIGARQIALRIDGAELYPPEAIQQARLRFTTSLKS
jgi:hypothetical protein